MPPFILTTVNILQMVVKAWPDIQAFYTRVRELFNMWHAGGLITVEQQQRLMQWADAHQEAVLRGDVPPELQVEPDPTSNAT